MRIILKLLAAPFVLALTLLVAVLNFAFSFASWVFCTLSFLCLIGALFALFTGDRWGIVGRLGECPNVHRTLGGVILVKAGSLGLHDPHMVKPLIVLYPV